MIAIVDYGAGNLRSVSKALDHLGVANRITDDPASIKEADRLILPGVGAFGACVQGVRDRGFEPAIHNFVATGRPFLGICVGMQILLETSEESPETPGLGVLRGSTPRFKGDLKIPHIGWNQVIRNGARATLFKGIPDSAYFYFVHSYYVLPSGADADAVVGRAEYGCSFAAALEKGNVFATQFHPEKSQKWGLKFLENFATV